MRGDMKITTLPELDSTYRAARRAMVQRKNDEGMTQTQAARELGVSLQCLNSIVKREGIQWRSIRMGPRKGRDAIPSDKVLEYLRDGCGAEDIAIMLSCPPDAVRAEISCLRAFGALERMYRG